MYLVHVHHCVPDVVKKQEVSVTLTLTYTHEGLKQAGGCEEPEHTDNLRH